MSAETQHEEALPQPPGEDPRRLPVTGFDHLELFVGNAEHTAAHLQHAFGFSQQARQGPGTGVQDIVSLFLVQGEARLLLTSGLTPRHDAAVHTLAHGDSVKDVALTVEGMNDTYLGVKERGVEPLHLPVEMEDALGRTWICPVDGMGPLIHTYVDRSEYDGWPAPGFVPVEGARGEPVGIDGTKAVAMVVQPGTLDVVTDRYQRLLDADSVEKVEADETEQDGFSWKASTVTRGRLHVRLVEPARRVRRSHLDDFLRLHGGPGVYVITFTTDDVAVTVEQLRNRGIRLLHTAADYAATEPLQERSPLIFELVPTDHAGPPDLDHLRATHAVLERRYRQRADEPLLPREAAGR
jgi:4-hydroxyphenylpyruvate dioxygenase